MTAAVRPGLARCTSDPAGRLRSEMSMARAMADRDPAARERWLPYARGIENALRTLGHPVAEPAPPVVLGVPVSAELLDAVETIAIVCAREGISLAEWYAQARREAAR